MRYYNDYNFTAGYVVLFNLYSLIISVAETEITDIYRTETTLIHWQDTEQITNMVYHIRRPLLICDNLKVKWQYVAAFRYLVNQILTSLRLRCLYEHPNLKPTQFCFTAIARGDIAMPRGYTLCFATLF